MVVSYKTLCSITAGADTNAVQTQDIGAHRDLSRPSVGTSTPSLPPTLLNPQQPLTLLHVYNFVISSVPSGILWYIAFGDWSSFIQHNSVKDPARWLCISTFTSFCCIVFRGANGPHIARLVTHQRIPGWFPVPATRNKSAVSSCCHGLG